MTHKLSTTRFPWDSDGEAGLSRVKLVRKSNVNNLGKS
jgi:hypothetical protein